MSKKTDKNGGVSIAGHVTVGGDIVGGDKTVYGDEIRLTHPEERVRDQRPTAWQASRDFTLKMMPVAGGRYRVEAQGPTGEASTTFELPVDHQDLESLMLNMGGRHGAATAGRVPEPVQGTVDMGKRLYDAVIGGAVRDTFVSARHDAAQHGCSLRLNLRLADAPELSNLPWEYLYDGHDFLALSADTPVVRYLDLPQTHRPMHVELPLRMLVTISSPRDLEPLDVRAEQETVEAALAGMAGRVKIDVLADVTLHAFQRVLRRARRAGRPYHVWHHVGHGAFDPDTQSSVLMFADSAGMSSPVGGFQLGTLFNSYPEVRLALLNACAGARAGVQDPFAGVAAALVERGIPAVIGMRFEISDEAALTFSQEFYTALVDGLPVDTAVTEARRAIFFLPNWVEWATPVLYMRSRDGRLFNLQGPVNGDPTDKKTIKAREQAQAERQQREDDERKARETAERKAGKKAERQAGKDAKRRE
jgi:CHAT domain-containing protein